MFEEEKTSASTRKKKKYISEKCTPIHKSANPTNKDEKFFMYLSLTLFFFFFISFYLLECAHVSCRTLLLYFSLSFFFAICSFWGGSGMR